MRKSTKLCLLGLVIMIIGYGLAYYSAQVKYVVSNATITIVQHPYFTIGSVVMTIGILAIIFGLAFREIFRGS
jgi:hypothetical protein